MIIVESLKERIKKRRDKIKYSYVVEEESAGGKKFVSSFLQCLLGKT